VKSEIHAQGNNALIASLACTVALPNTIDVVLSATESAKLTTPPARWDLQLTWANGDIQTPEDVVAMWRHTQCAGIMVARGSFGNPWLFTQAREMLAGRAKPADPTPDERFAVALEHARLAVRLQGDTRKTVIEFRKHLGWYTRGLRDASELRQRLFQVESMEQAESIFTTYLERATVEASA